MIENDSGVKTLFVKRYHFLRLVTHTSPFCNFLRPLYPGKNRSSVESTKSPAEDEKERWPSNSDSCIEGNFDRCFSSSLHVSGRYGCHQIRILIICCMREHNNSICFTESPIMFRSENACLCSHPLPFNFPYANFSGTIAMIKMTGRLPKRSIYNRFFFP